MLKRKLSFQDYNRANKIVKNLLDFPSLDDIVAAVQLQLVRLLVILSQMHSFVLTCFARAPIQVYPVLLSHVPLIEDRVHLPAAERELIHELVSVRLFRITFLLFLLFVCVLILLDLCMDLLGEGILQVLDEARVGNELHVVIEAELSSLVHILRIEVELLVLSHELFTLTAKAAAWTILFLGLHYRRYLLQIGGEYAVLVLALFLLQLEIVLVLC